MDPISFLASVLGIADVAGRTSSMIWQLCGTWRDAPEDVHELRDSLIRANEFFLGIRRGLETEHQRATRTSGWDDETSRELDELLRRSEAVMKEVQGLLDRLLDGTNPPDVESLAKRRKLQWLKERGRASQLRHRLQELMFRICGAFMSINLTVSAESQEALRSLEDRIVTHIESQATVTQRVVNATITTTSTRMLTQIEDRLDQLQTEISGSISTGLGETQARITGAFADHIDRRLLEWHETRRPERAAVATRIERLDHRMASMEQFLAGLGRLLISAPTNTQQIPDYWTPFVHSTTATRRWMTAACEPSCQCRCHSIRRSGSWSLMSFRAVLGTVSLSYRGTLLGRHGCTYPRCRYPLRGRWLRLDYRLPDWLPGLLLTMSISMSGATGPEMLIRIVRRIPPDSASIAGSIIGAVRARDTTRVKWLLQNNLATVYDERGDQMETPFITACLLEDAPMAKLLLDAGADVLDHGKYEAVSNGATIMRFVIAGSPFGIQLAEMMPISAIMEDQEYTDMHKVVMGMLPIDLRSALRIPHFATQLEKPNLMGLTPMHIAAMRGDTVALRFMVEAGADLMRKGNNGLTPFHNACRSGNVEAVGFLLQHQADPNCRTIGGTTPLHTVSNFSDNGDLISLLLDHGADPDAKDDWGGTPLSFAAYFNRVQNLRCLLARGANVNTRDWEGDSPLTESLIRNSYASTKVLLQHGADYSTVNSNGSGFLHKLARDATVENLRVVGELGLKNLDPNLRNAAGKTPVDIFEARENISPELRAAFERLLETLFRGRQADFNATDEEGSDDEFFDAVDIPLET